MKILFVCTGNTCRSPMAQGIATKLFPDFIFSSAGIYVNSTSSASSYAVEALKDLNIDISSHISSQLTKELTNDFDYIIPMTLAHKQMLLAFGVEYDKIISFNEEIADPYGCSLEVYKNCAKQIENNIKQTIGEIYDNNFKWKSHNWFSLYWK